MSDPTKLDPGEALGEIRRQASEDGAGRDFAPGPVRASRGARDLGSGGISAPGGMGRQEYEARRGVLRRFWGVLGRRPADEVIEAYLRATATVPVHWLAQAAKDLGASWESSRTWPTAGDLYRAATRAAGFRPAYNPHGYQDPTPEIVAWWPAWPTRAPYDLAEKFALPAGSLGDLGGLRVLPVPRTRLPGGLPRRRLLESTTCREEDVSP